MLSLKRILTRLVLIIVGVVVALLTIEIGLRIVPEAKWKGVLSKSPERYTLFQTNEDIGWVHVPNAHAIWRGTGEYEVNVQINSLGLRDYEHTYDKPPDTFRILVLGDSLSEGIQVPLEQIFPVQLEQCLTKHLSRKIEVVNTGTSDYGPGDELLLYRHIGVKYNPDLVLIAIYTGNDIENMTRTQDGNMIKSFGGYQFYLEAGQLKQRLLSWAEPDNEILLFERLLRRYSKLYYIFASPDSTLSREFDKLVADWWPNASNLQLAEPVPNSHGYINDEKVIIFAKDFPHNPAVPQQIKNMWELFKAPFQQLQTEVEEHNAHLVAIIIPTGFQVHSTLYTDAILKLAKEYKNLKPTGWDISAPNRAISDFLAKQQITFLDLLPNFQTYAQTHDTLLYFRQDGHFNKEGHQLTAEATCNWLIENGLVNLNISGQAQK